MSDSMLKKRAEKICKELGLGYKGTDARHFRMIVAELREAVKDGVLTEVKERLGLLEMVKVDEAVTREREACARTVCIFCRSYRIVYLSDRSGTFYHECPSGWEPDFADNKVRCLASDIHSRGIK